VPFLALVGVAVIGVVEAEETAAGVALPGRFALVPGRPADGSGRAALRRKRPAGPGRLAPPSWHGFTLREPALPTIANTDYLMETLEPVVPPQQIRAMFDTTTIRVYQAYSDLIADSALERAPSVKIVVASIEADNPGGEDKEETWRDTDKHSRIEWWQRCCRRSAPRRKRFHKRSG
jgi:hypothetical protein